MSERKCSSKKESFIFAVKISVFMMASIFTMSTFASQLYSALL